MAETQLDTAAPGRERQLRILAIGLVAAMSPWFSTAAVLGQLRERWELSTTAASWLIIVVQLGFVAGAVLSAATNLADRIPPRRLVLLGSVVAAIANASIVITDGYVAALVGRFVTGAALAGVYPSAMKAMSSWYRTGRGHALGVMIAALTIGSALPHLINGIGSLAWRPLMIAISIITIAGGLIADRLCADGPYTMGAAAFDPRQAKAIVTNPKFRLASLGYFGHMWELYAMWAWIAVFFGDVFASKQAASLAAFAVIGSGAIGSVYAGSISDRVSRHKAAELAMRWSALAAVVTGFLVDAPWPLVVAAGLVWGFWVVADSAQFSTIVTEVTDPRYVGTALTMQLAAGFVLTVFTIFLVPVVRDAFNWGFAFAMLAPGPLLGVWAMRRLEHSS